MRSATLDTLGGRTAPGAATEYNAYLKDRLAQGKADLSVVFDRPSRMGLDSDSPWAHGLVGVGGVAVDSIDDMRILFGGIPRQGVSTRLTLDPPSVPLLLLYQLVQEEQGRVVRHCSVLLRRSGRAGAYEGRLIECVLRLAAAEGIRVELTDAEEESAGSRLGLPHPPPASSPVAIRQAERLSKLRAWRCHERVDAALTLLRRAARADGDLLPPMREALAAGATIGETSATGREALDGSWRSPDRN